MQRFFSEPSIGIEITSRAIRLGVLARKGGIVGPLASTTIDVPAGMVNEGFSVQPFGDREGLAALLRTGLQRISPRPLRKAGLSLPDSLFRVQVLEFDDLPAGRRDQERLMRWRVEKGSTFDTANALFRFQVHALPKRGFSVLACLAKQDIIAGYEQLLEEARLEVLTIAPSSLLALNFYAPYIAAQRVSGYALTWITDGSYTTIIMEHGGPRFYRHKELRGGVPGDIAARLLREIDDSIHFYAHRDREQAAEIGHLYCAGDPSLAALVAEEFRQASTLSVEVLDPAAVIARGDHASPVFAAAYGAGGALW